MSVICESNMKSAQFDIPADIGAVCLEYPFTDFTIRIRKKAVL